MGARPQVRVEFKQGRVLPRLCCRRGRLAGRAALEEEAGQVVHCGRALRRDADVQRLQARVQRAHQERERGRLAARHDLRRRLRRARGRARGARRGSSAARRAATRTGARSSGYGQSKRLLHTLLSIPLGPVAQHLPSSLARFLRRQHRMPFWRADGSAPVRGCGRAHPAAQSRRARPSGTP
jgi:hypothetical protein